MAPSKFLFCLTCVLFWNMAVMNGSKQTVHQVRSFKSAYVGGKLTLRCAFESGASKYYWYKQTLGQNLQLICTSFKLDQSGTFYNEFKHNPRFKLETEAGTSQLQISDLQVSDTGTYFCASGLSLVFEFGEGTTVSVKDSGLETRSLVHQSGPETVQSGGSVTLNCSVQTGACDGEHSVYWFKDTQGPLPSLIYTHGSRNDQCERKPNTPTHTCVFNLSVKNLNASHVGTYYCAVASCGHILFGNGTQLDLKSEASSLHLVYFLSGALTFTTVLSVLIAFMLHKMNKRNGCQT